jgi:hypothetical protein
VPNLDRAFFVDMTRRIRRIVKVGEDAMAERDVDISKQERKKERRAREALFDVLRLGFPFPSRRPPAYEIIFLIPILRLNASFPLLSTAQGKCARVRLDRLREIHEAV